MKKNILLAALLWTGGRMSLYAQSCSGTVDLSGSYLFVASKSLFTEALPVPTNVNNVPPRYSNTLIGQLIRRSSGTDPFTLTGRLIADGQGTLLTGAPDAQFVTTRVGTYTVGIDCSVTITIRDGYLAEDPLALDNPRTVQFQGMLQSRGGEAVLTQTSQGSGTSLTLTRAQLATSCSRSVLSGPYAISASGYHLTNEGETPASNATVKPFALHGRIVSDGAGTLFADDVALAARVPSLQFTGTYTVEQDCTGTMKIASADGKTKYSLAIVVVQANPAQSLPQFGTTQLRPALRFVVTDGNIRATGTGREATGRF